MDRRTALKNMGLSTGFFVITPAVVSLLQSCTNSNTLPWKPVYLSESEAGLLSRMIDLILPKTEKYPGALEVDVPRFIDAYVDAVLEPEKQESFKKGIQTLQKTLEDEGSDLPKFIEKHFSDKNSAVYPVLSNIRKMSIWAFLTSEKIGEEVLAYDPVPGVFVPCLPVDEATGGKAWSLQ